MRALLLVAILLLLIAAGPPAAAVEPRWQHPADPGNEFSMLAVSRDGSLTVAGGDQLTAVDGAGKKLWSGWSSTHLDVSENGTYILASQVQILRLFSRDGIMLWDQSVVTPVSDLSMTPDATRIAVAGSGSVSTLTSAGIGIGTNRTPGIGHLKISPAGDQVILTTDHDVQRVNMSIVPIWYDANASQDLVDISRDGTMFVTVTFNRVRLYHAGGALLWEKVVPGGNALALRFSRDGSTIVLGRDDNTVRVMDRNGTLLWTGEAGNWVTSVDLADDGSIIAAGSMDRNLYIFDRAGHRLGTYTTQTPIRSHSVGVSGDGSVIAVADLNAVYGFSRAQFEEPAPTPVPTTVTTVPVTTTVPATSTATTATTTAPPVTTTPRSPADPLLLLATMGAIVLLRPKRNC